MNERCIAIDKRRSMSGGPVWRAGFVLGVMLFLGACGHRHNGFDADASSDDGANAYPTTYKSDILGAMHAYLNDPTGIRDAAIAEPTLKASGNATRYLVCVRFNPKKNASEYTGAREVAASFLGGRFDHFIETLHDQCAGASYAPFPELEKLPP